MNLNIRRQMADSRRIRETSKVNRSPKDLPSFKNLVSLRTVSHLTYCLLLTAACLLVLSGCEEPFQPLQENDTVPFSMQGYLDASADTQWLRIAPVRDRLAMPPAKPEMRVTLEELESGNTVVMNDSLFQHPDGFNYLNVWTTMDIRPEQTYRLEAELPDGASSRVTVTIPEDFPFPNLEAFDGGCSGEMRIDGVERLADVKSVWHMRFFFNGRADDRFYSTPYRSMAYSPEPGSYLVYIDSLRELNRITDDMISRPDSLRIISRDLFVASGGPEWIEDIGSLGELVYALPEGFSNVENGVGYVVGIVSRTIPLDHCF